LIAIKQSEEDEEKIKLLAVHIYSYEFKTEKSGDLLHVYESHIRVEEARKCSR
jgi:hypothetical protein